MSQRVLIVDDERLARVALRKILEKRRDLEIIGEANSVATAVHSIKSLNPDIVFLDIEMADGLGFDVFDKTPVSAHVIFVTAYNQHALRAFEVNALDYIVKPVDPTHIDRALQRIATVSPAEPEKEHQFTADDMICLQESKSMKFTRVRDIVFIAAADDYAEVHLANGTTALISERLRRWESILPENFARTHRATLVNLDYIEKIEQSDGAWTIQLRSCDKTLVMSRRFAQALKKRIHLVG